MDLFTCSKWLGDSSESRLYFGSVKVRITETESIGSNIPLGKSTLTQDEPLSLYIRAFNISCRVDLNGWGELFEQWITGQLDDADTVLCFLREPVARVP